MSLVLRIVYPLLSLLVTTIAEYVTDRDDVADGDSFAQDDRLADGDELTDEVFAALSVGNRQLVQTRIGAFESFIQPMYSSIAKNEFGRLGQSAVRYALHRFFVARHGWFVHGLFAGQGGSGWQGLTVEALLEKHMPAFAQSAFANGFNRSGGLDLHGVALLAAVIEVSVFDNAEKDLRACYKMQRVPLDAVIDEKQVDRLLALHVGRRILEANADRTVRYRSQNRSFRKLFLAYMYRKKRIKNINEYAIEDVERFLTSLMPQWPLTREFLVGLRLELQPGRSEFRYETVAGLAREIEGRWARWASAQDCKSMKAKLLKMEEGTSGCVRLSDFYNYSLHSAAGWSFKESPQYLADLGVLDNSKDVPRVVIPNYIQSQSNCIPMTKNYMACCVSECEGVQLQIESSLHTPEVEPEAILQVVNQLPSSVLDGRKQIPGVLKRHLKEIAVLHGGRVPLQSRLFAQWMHFVFPHECPFPHHAGSKVPEQPHLGEHFVTDGVASNFVETGLHLDHTQRNGTCMQWDQEEEFFVTTFVPSTTTLAVLEQDHIVWASIYLVACLSVLPLVLAVLLRSMKRTKSQMTDLTPTLTV